MKAVTRAEISQLRELSSAGVLDCKQALEEADGDLGTALRILRRNGAKDAARRSQRVAANGLVAAQLVGTAAAVMLELRCETDFAAKNERFRRLAAEVVNAAARSAASDRLELLDEHIGPGVTVAERIGEVAAVIKEKLELGRFTRLEGGLIVSYLHKSDPSLPPTVGALVQLDGQHGELGRNLAQQVAAMAPRYVSRSDVPAELIAGQRRSAEQAARDEGKPETVVQKIAVGRLNSFLKNIVLAEQAYIKDPKRTVGQLLAAAGITVQAFARYRIGEP